MSLSASAGGNHNAKRKRDKEESQKALDIWQFRWQEETSGGKRVYRRKEIETARKAAGLLVPDLNARKANSESSSMTIAQLSIHFEQHELCIADTWRSYSTKLSTRFTCANGSFLHGANTD
jgi:hypothetical protein